MMDVENLIELLFTASNARTDEEKARVAWRASDILWEHIDVFPVGFCRKFNNYCQDQKWPWIKDLWSKEEKEQRIGELLARLKT
jgi:predicted lipoprotein